MCNPGHNQGGMASLLSSALIPLSQPLLRLPGQGFEQHTCPQTGSQLDGAGTSASEGLGRPLSHFFLHWDQTKIQQVFLGYLHVPALILKHGATMNNTDENVCSHGSHTVIEGRKYIINQVSVSL